MTILGEYSRYGYSVFSQSKTGVIQSLHQAGNCQWDSATVLEPGSAGCVPPRKLRSACLKTAKEIAAEQKLPFGGIERAEENKPC